jgi:hypothetical protein
VAITLIRNKLRKYEHLATQISWRQIAVCILLRVSDVHYTVLTTLVIILEEALKFLFVVEKSLLICNYNVKALCHDTFRDYKKNASSSVLLKVLKDE